MIIRHPDYYKELEKQAKEFNKTNPPLKVIKQRKIIDKQPKKKDSK